MATLEQFGILCQITDQIFRLTRNMRRNAAEYTALANRLDAGTAPAGTTVSTLAAMMHGDASQFLIRLTTLTDAAARNQTLVTNALGIIGVTLGQANTIKSGLVTVGEHLRDATLTTTQQCRDEAAFVLANAPNYDGLF